jgi:diaminohydroxyphosphoribosylaminopyrimidine deaminase / 5-amino-6-(5-phosphoribosylamino)uracil reductase
MIQSTEDKFMKRCLELAEKAQGMTSPNPVVGSVIVHNGKIIGEGFHLKAGKEHAEVNAINSVKDKSLLQKSTLYVSLEPCSHTGKTPPCADLIVASRIPEVVIGTIDTTDKVAGKGISKLKDAGCNVKTGILEEECRWINRRFFTYHEKKRPYIILKWAQSNDGFIDAIRTDENNTPVRISGDAERVLVHKWRSEEEAILVGAGTIRADKPGLDVRYWTGKNPLRVILSGSGNIKDYQLQNKTNSSVILFSDLGGENSDMVRNVVLEKGIPACRQVIDYLYKQKIQSLLIEGGARLLNHFIEHDLWDEARVFTGKTELKKGVKAPLLKGKAISETEFEKSVLNIIIKE